MTVLAPELRKQIPFKKTHAERIIPQRMADTPLLTQIAFLDRPTFIETGIETLPTFPDSKPLEITDKFTIENFTSQFPPYSDFNFTSMWSWDTENTARIAQHNGNLVVKFADYITQEPFYSFLGINNVDQTIAALLSQSQSEGLQPALKLIPEIVVQGLSLVYNKWQIEEDKDNFDYILSTDEHSSLEGTKFQKKRNMLKKFISENKKSIKIANLDIANPNIQNQINAIFYQWIVNNNKNTKDTNTEFEGLQKLLANTKHLKLISTGVSINEQLIAFSIKEVIHDKTGIIHFKKANIAYRGIYEYLMNQDAICFKQLGCNHINYEQDLGIEGLKKSKTLNRPVKYLKKYTISTD